MSDSTPFTDAVRERIKLLKVHDKAIEGLALAVAARLDFSFSAAAHKELRALLDHPAMVVPRERGDADPTRNLAVPVQGGRRRAAKVRDAKDTKPKDARAAGGRGDGAARVRADAVAAPRARRGAGAG